jgi:phosphoribosylformylglycinamidine cyclo-ligase
VLHFVDDVHVIKDNLFDIPPLFRLIHDQSGTDWKEMYKVFNMGHRMEIYLPQAHAQQVIDIAKSFNLDAQIVGHVEAGKKQVSLRTPFGEFTY